MLCERAFPNLGYMRIQCATQKRAPALKLARYEMGWLMGLEPTTTGITILDSTN